MKAGIFKTPNDNFIYVSKDRTVQAMTLSPGGWVGQKVSYRKADNTVTVPFYDVSYRATFVCGVPNGCTDHQTFVGLVKRMVEAGLDPSELLGVPVRARESYVWSREELARKMQDVHIAHTRLHEGGTPSSEGKAVVLVPGGQLVGPELAARISFKDLKRRMHEAVDSGNEKLAVELGDSYRSARAAFYDDVIGERVTGVPRALSAGYRVGEQDEVVHVSVNSEGGDVSSLRRAMETPPTFARGLVHTSGDVNAIPADGRRYKVVRPRWLPDNFDELLADGYRRCHKQSARKHRRAGHKLVPLTDGSFLWRAS